jgi:predicted nucleotidyltransferase
VAINVVGLDSVRAAALDRIVSRLAAWQPDRIILFGSHARGDARSDSDLDLLVVLADAATVTRGTVVDMRLAIGDLPVDYDLVVTSRDDYAWRREYVGAIEYPAAHEGIELHGA